MTTSQAAERLGVTPGRVRQLLRAGKLKFSWKGDKALPYREISEASVSERIRELGNGK